MGELVQGRLEILYDFSREYRGVGQVVGVFQGFVAKPGDVEAELVAFLQIFVVEAAEAFGLFAFVSVGRVVAGDEIVEVGLLERAGLEGEVLVGA